MTQKSANLQGIYYIWKKRKNFWKNL